MVGVPGSQQFGSVADALARVARTEPLAVVLAVVVVLLAAASLVVAVRWYRRTPGEELLATLAAKDEVAVLMHPNPDPDAMASALGVARLADTVDTGATIYFPGQIRHQENRAFRTVLDLDFQNVETISDIPPRPIVLVDHNEARGFGGAQNIVPYAVVDHHPGPGEGSAFTDVRMEYGACATIVAGYFRDLGVVPTDPESPEETALSTSLATGLLYGVLSDTNDLTRGCSPAEFDAAEYLYAGVDEELLDRIAHPQVDREVLDVKARAISNRVVRNPYAVSNVGEVGNVDAIPQAADELVQLEGVSTVVVYGRRDGVVHLSGRSRDDRVHMGEALQVALDGLDGGTAGGHARMGGGQVRSVAVGEQFHETLFAAMSGQI
ncbi:MAG: bifunctional oligoribonuclease/PAP phosphatase NrnA [Halobacteriaceae archaeon]